MLKAILNVATLFNGKGTQMLIGRSIDNGFFVGKTFEDLLMKLCEVVAAFVVLK